MSFQNLTSGPGVESGHSYGSTEESHGHSEHKHEHGNHDGFAFVFARDIAGHKLHIRECPDGDEIICEPPLETPQLTDIERTSLVHNLKNKELAVSRYTHYELAYSEEHPDRFIYCVVSIKEKEAMEWADSKEIELEAEAQVAVHLGRKLHFPLAMHTLLPNDSSTEITVNGVSYKKLPLHIWNNIHLPYSSHNPHQNLYKVHGSGHELLENRMQLRILYQILSGDQRLGGAALSPDTDIWRVKHPLQAFFALHCHHDRELSLTNEDIYGLSKICSMWNDKIDPIRNYYGEVVGFYFAFLSHYTRSLFPFAGIGIVYFAIQVGLQEISMNAFAVLVLILAGIVWSTAMIEYWYRREWELRFEWGMMRAAEMAVPRPEFEGNVQISSTTGELIETYSNFCGHYCKVLTSLSTVLLCLFGVIAIVFGIWTAKRIRPGSFWWSVLIGVANAVQIQIMNYLYLQFALILNAWEDHRMQDDYVNSLVIKKIVFYCVNSFNSLFLIAFIQPLYCKANAAIGIVCDNRATLQALRIQLVTLFVAAIVINNFMEFVFPPIYVRIIDWMYKVQETKKADSEQIAPLLSDDAGVQQASTKVFAHSAEFQSVDLDVRAADSDASDEHHDNHHDDEKTSEVSQAPALTTASRDMVRERAHRKEKQITEDIFQDIEAQMKLAPVPDMLDNMAEIVVQYGYIMLFIIVFPLMPLLGIINNFVEMRVDLYNVLNTQRPAPRATGGIGVWKQVMSVFSVIAVFTNMGILCYRTDQITEIVGHQFVNIFFFVACIAIVGVIIAVRNLIEDIPNHIREGIERQEYCEKHLVMGAVKQQLKELTMAHLPLMNDFESTRRIHVSIDPETAL